MVLHEMGTIDHAVALKAQLRDAAALVSHVVVADAPIPPWASDYFLPEDELREQDALRMLAEFSAVWLPEPYEKLRPAVWRELWERAPIVYSGYGIPLFDWKQGLYGLSFFDKCSLILAPGPRDELEHREASAGRRNVILSGDPLLYEIAKLRDNSSDNQEITSVLWAPHWSKTWVDGSRGFATWEWAVVELYRFFRRHSDIDLIVRPHPHLNFNEGRLLSRATARKLLALPNVHRSEVSIVEDIERTDLLVSDGVSILAYFGVTGKPVVVLGDRKAQAPFNELGREIVARMVNVMSGKELATLLSNVSSNSQLFPEPDEVISCILENFIVERISPGRQLVDSISIASRG